MRVRDQEYYLTINDKFDVRFAYMINKHSRVLFFSFVVRFPLDYPHDGFNKELSELLRLVKEKLTRNDNEMHYVWCREKDTSGNPHYHVAALLNGNHVRNVYDILKDISHTWMRITYSPKAGLIEYGKYYNGQWLPNEIMIERPSPNRASVGLAQQHWEFDAKIKEMNRQAHYLGKIDQKGDVPRGVREYGSSELPKADKC